jgi:hypothetical protein
MLISFRSGAFCFSSFFYSFQENLMKGIDKDQIKMLYCIRTENL